MGTQRGHSGCASTGTDTRVIGTVTVKVKHVIDRGRGAQSTRHLALVLVSEGNPTQVLGSSWPSAQLVHSVSLF